MGRLATLCLFVLPLIYSICVCKKVDLTTSDLGRHISNGKFISAEVLNTNYYSYTNSNFKVINHHFLSGVIFNLIYEKGNFVALSLFFAFISFCTALIFSYIALKLSSTFSYFVAFIFSLPLILERTEIRPEVFSYFYSALLILFFYLFLQKKLSLKVVFIITAVICAIWINTHIYFFVALVITGSFLLSFLISKNYRNFIIFSGLLVAEFIGFFLNPFGIKAIIYPLQILSDYGYQVVENQSVLFLDNLGFVANSNLFYFKVVVLAFFILLPISLLTLKKITHSFVYILFVSFGLASFLAIRNFTIFGFVAVLAFSLILENLRKQKVFLATTLLIFGILFVIPKIRGVQMGLGLKDGVLESAKFFKNNNIKGPIFNNYDIGGYLIFNLFPKEKVFVDNRPEAYPPSFLKDVYVRMQEDEAIWKSSSNNWNINAIFFSYLDITPWAQTFLKARIEDPVWVPVFADKYAIIFLKDYNENKEIIDKYKIGKEAFTFRK